MTLSDLFSELRSCPLVASVQASEGSPVDDPATLLRLAQASIDEGVRVLRLQGVENIRTIKSSLDVPVIGLIKERYAGSEVYITPTIEEVEALIATGCEIIAIDATTRLRPNGATVKDLVAHIHAAGRLAMADCDTLASARDAVAAGADVVSSTLSGYTAETESTLSSEPDLDLLHNLTEDLPQLLPRNREHEYAVLAEGRYSEAWQVRAALRAGASGVVIGGAINDPIKQTRSFVRAAARPKESVGAIDIGGTWIRAGVFRKDWELLEQRREKLPLKRKERIAWINDWIRESGVQTIGISTGGVVEPNSGEVVSAKPLIPDHIGTRFHDELDAPRVQALNDGHATAWGHAMHRRYAGRTVASLALGTGVGFGLVHRGRLMMGPDGDYPRLNDTPTSLGRTFEELLGGAALSSAPSDEQIEDAMVAAEEAVRLVFRLYYPEVIVIGGGVGLAPWMDIERLRDELPDFVTVDPSPFGLDAGLYGAAALALFPPSFG